MLATDRPLYLLSLGTNMQLLDVKETLQDTHIPVFVPSLGNLALRVVLRSI